MLAVAPVPAIMVTVVTSSVGSDAAVGDRFAEYGCGRPAVEGDGAGSAAEGVERFGVRSDRKDQRAVGPFAGAVGCATVPSLPTNVGSGSGGMPFNLGCVVACGDFAAADHDRSSDEAPPAWFFPQQSSATG